MTVFSVNKEDIFFIITGIGFINYAIFEFYKFGHDKNIQDTTFGLTDGWTTLGRKRMKFDLVYQHFFVQLKLDICWLVLHCICCEIVTSFFKIKKLPWVHALFGFSYLCYTYDPLFIATSVVMTLTFYFSMQTRKIKYVWFNICAWLTYTGFLVIDVPERNIIPERLEIFDIFIGLVAIGWQTLRLASYALDFCDAQNHPSKSHIKSTNAFNLETLLGFGFYLPVFSQGPPLLFSKYARIIDDGNERFNLFSRTKRLTKELVQLAGTCLVTVFLMHYVYTTPVIYNQDLLFELDGWPLYGMVLSRCLYFGLAYMIKYQLGGAFARFDWVDAPHKPKCILRLHKSTILWRYFDTGFYDFVVTYIYVPISKLNSHWNKFGRFFVFIFVSFWHGITFNFDILIWIWVNFCMVYIEAAGQKIIKTNIYSRMSNELGSKTMSHINTFIGSQLMIIQIISYMLFLAGEETLIHIIDKTYLNNSIFCYIVLSSAAYCVYRTCQLILGYELYVKSYYKIEKSQ